MFALGCFGLILLGRKLAAKPREQLHPVWRRVFAFGRRALNLVARLSPLSKFKTVH